MSLASGSRCAAGEKFAGCNEIVAMSTLFRSGIFFYIVFGLIEFDGPDGKEVGRLVDCAFINCLIESKASFNFLRGVTRIFNQSLLIK